MRSISWRAGWLQRAEETRARPARRAAPASATGQTRPGRRVECALPARMLWNISATISIVAFSPLTSRLCFLSSAVRSRRAVATCSTPASGNSPRSRCRRQPPRSTRCWRSPLPARAKPARTWLASNSGDAARQQALELPQHALTRGCAPLARGVSWSSCGSLFTGHSLAADDHAMRHGALPGRYPPWREPPGPAIPPPTPPPSCAQEGRTGPVWPRTTATTAPREPAALRHPEHHPARRCIRRLVPRCTHPVGRAAAVGTLPAVNPP
jgi:hypothetical protein